MIYSLWYITALLIPSQLQNLLFYTTNFYLLIINAANASYTSWKD